MTFILTTQRACAAETSVRPDLRRRRARRRWGCGRDSSLPPKSRSRRALTARSWIFFGAWRCATRTVG